MDELLGFGVDAMLHQHRNRTAGSSDRSQAMLPVEQPPVRGELDGLPSQMPTPVGHVAQVASDDFLTQRPVQRVVAT